MIYGQLGLPPVRSCAETMANSEVAQYEAISPADASSLPNEYTHAGHVMFYAPQPAKLFGKYDLKYVILVSSLILLTSQVISLLH